MPPPQRKVRPVAKTGLRPTEQYRTTPPEGSTLKIAHITDTHLGTNERSVYSDEPGFQTKIEEQYPSFRRFRDLVRTLRRLDPDIIIHTGDIIESDLWDDWNRFERFCSSLPTLPESPLLLYIRGNHDATLEERDLRKLFPGCDPLSLENSSPLHLAGGEVIVHGRDNRNHTEADGFGVCAAENHEEAVVIGAYHQTVQPLSSGSPDIELTDLAPPEMSPVTYYDLLLFGHMHLGESNLLGDCLLIDGGCALGSNVKPTVGLITLCRGGSHYQVFPLSG